MVWGLLEEDVWHAIGKSTLMGRLLAELGFVGQKTVHHNQRESAAVGKASFSWAWVLDER